MKYIILAMFAMVTAALTATDLFAGEKGGNGGTSVIVNGKPIMLDLIEGGIEGKLNYIAPAWYKDMKDNSSNDTTVSIDYYMQWINSYNHYYNQNKIFDSEIMKSLSFAFRVTNRSNPMIAAILAAAMYQLDWSFVNFDLGLTNDTSSIVDLSKYSIKLAAVRKGNSIKISIPIWNRMDIVNKTALILHELLYSIVIPEKDSNGLMIQDVELVRQAVSDWMKNILISQSASNSVSETWLTFEKYKHDEKYVFPFNKLISHNKINGESINSVRNNIIYHPMFNIYVQDDNGEVISSGLDCFKYKINSTININIIANKLSLAFSTYNSNDGIHWYLELKLENNYEVIGGINGDLNTSFSFNSKEECLMNKGQKIHDSENDLLEKYNLQYGTNISSLTEVLLYY